MGYQPRKTDQKTPKVIDMGCNIPRPTKRPPTPNEEYMKKAVEEPIMTMNEIRAKCGLDPVQDPERCDLVTAAQFAMMKKEHATNCPNCCAVITGPICEYCGTRFGGYDPGDPKGDAIIIPVYIGGEKVSEVIKGMDAFRQFHRMSYDFGVNSNEQKDGDEE